MATPKEFLKRIAETQDQLMEVATQPLKDIAATLGLPTPPEPPKAADIVESLPELPTPEAILGQLPQLPVPTPAREKVAGAERLELPKEEVKEKLEYRIV